MHSFGIRQLARLQQKVIRKHNFFLDLVETFVDLLVPHPDGNISDSEILFFYASLFSNSEEIMRVSYGSQT